MGNDAGECDGEQWRRDRWCRCCDGGDDDDNDAVDNDDDGEVTEKSYHLFITPSSYNASPLIGTASAQRPDLSYNPVNILQKREHG
eukprot:168171-Hanusia_phi.AAC.1